MSYRSALVTLWVSLLFVLAVVVPTCSAAASLVQTDGGVAPSRAELLDVMRAKGISSEDLSLFADDGRDPPTPSDLTLDPLFAQYLRERTEQVWRGSLDKEDDAALSPTGGRRCALPSSADGKDEAHLWRLTEARCPEGGGQCELSFECFDSLIG